MNPWLWGAVAVLVLSSVPMPATGEEPKEPRDWSWLVPGETTKTQVIERAGDPWQRHSQRIVKGEIELRLGGAGPLDARRAKDTRPDLEVEVLVYRAAGRSPHDRLVFHADRLLYALVETRAREQSASDLEATLGKSHRTVQTYVSRALSYDVYDVLAFEEKHTAFARAWSKEPGPYRIRICWASPDRKFPGLEGVTWKLPEGRPTSRQESDSSKK